MMALRYEALIPVAEAGELVEMNSGDKLLVASFLQDLQTNGPSATDALEVGGLGTDVRMAVIPGTDIAIVYRADEQRRRISVLRIAKALDLASRIEQVDVDMPATEEIPTREIDPEASGQSPRSRRRDISSDEIIAALRQLGFKEHRRKPSHVVMQRSGGGGQRVVVVPANLRSLPHNTIRTIARSAGLEADDIAWVRR